MARRQPQPTLETQRLREEVDRFEDVDFYGLLVADWRRQNAAPEP